MTAEEKWRIETFFNELKKLENIFEIVITGDSDRLHFKDSVTKKPIAIYNEDEKKLTWF